VLIQRFYTLAAVCCLLTLSPVTPAVADEDIVDDIEEVGERCVNTRRISGTYIADDQTIIFAGDKNLEVLTKKRTRL